MDKLKKHALWTAIITPMDSQAEIDFETFGRLLQRQEQAGNAIVVLGSTGEAMNLGQKEKKQMVRFVLDLKLKVPLMLGVGGAQLGTQLEWIEYGQHFDAFLLPTPHYAKPGIKGQIKWFESLLTTAAKPCMLYNIPGRAAAPLHPESLKVLADHPHAWALKEASGSLDHFIEYKKLAPKLDFFSGDDAMTPYFCQEGGVGLVSVASNVWPKASALFVQKCLEGKIHEVLPLWEKACTALFKASNPIPIKALMAAKKLIRTPQLRLPLLAEDMQGLDQLLDYDRQIVSWFEQGEHHEL